VPSGARAVLAAGAVPDSVRVITVGGEQLPRRVVADAFALPHLLRFWNVYGPTEDTTFSTAAVFESAPDEEPSIGFPLHGTRAYVLDTRLRPLPLGVAGEL